MKHLFCICAIGIITSLPFAENSGEILAQKILKDTTLHVVKPFHGTIADAYKINEMPVVRDSVPPPPKLTYGINSKKVFTTLAVDPLNAAKMVGEPLVMLNRGLIKIGGGNYNTPYTEAFYNNLRSKDVSYGAHLKHISSKATLKGYGFGGYSENEAGVYGKKFLHKQTLAGNLDYNRDVVHYYGYDTAIVKVEDNNYIRQRYSFFGVNTSLQSHHADSIHLNHLLQLKYYNLTDYYHTSENNMYASGDISGFYEKQLVHVPLSIDYYSNRSDSDTTHSAIISLAPYIIYSGDKWSTRIGMNITIDGNPDNKSRFLFYPNIDFNYNIADNIIIPYGGFTGRLKRNSLRSLTEENPFLLPAPHSRNTNQRWEMYGGLRGSISKTVSYNTRCSYSRIQDMYFFANDNSRVFQKGFNVIYDDVTILNVHGELQYQYTEKIKLIAKGDYNQYDLKSELKPWHKPLWQTDLTLNYNLRNKIVATLDVFMYGTRFAYTPMEGQGAGITVISTSIKELKPIVDANIGLEYRYSKKLSGFLNLNNLGFNRYYYWNNYPTYKFNFLAGITLAF